MDVGTLQTAPRFGVFERDDELADAGHEQIVFCRDEASGLRAIISIHDTTLGPALGGTRFADYPSEAAALRDGLRLSQAMTSKAAAAGLPLGGGKGVIIGDPRTSRSADLLRAYGRFIESLGGRYITAADVGTTAEDLDIVGTTTRYVAGRTVAAGGSGDSGHATASGVFSAMSAAATLRWGAEGLRGRRVGVEGVGKVGLQLSRLLAGAGAVVSVSDPDPVALGRASASIPGLTVTDAVIGSSIDVYAPCALGGTLTPASVDGLAAEIVCGAANNQLATDEVDSLLRSRDVLWVPDYIANAGGLVQVGSEFLGRGQDGVRSAIEHIGETVTALLTLSADLSVSTGEAAVSIVRSRLAAGANRLPNEGSDDAH